METTNTFQPEKLCLWDRLFNRYRKVVVEEGEQTWSRLNKLGQTIPGTNYTRRFVKYKVIDRVTGSERIQIEHLS